MDKSNSLGSIKARGASGYSSLPGAVKNMVAKGQYVEARYYVEDEIYATTIENPEGQQGFNCNIYNLENNFPEMQNDNINKRPNTGVCFSGGGSRSLVLSMGQLRGLQTLGLMDKIRYIASASGGTWSSSIFTYQKQFSDADMLGSGVIEPENIDISEVGQNIPQMAEIAVNRGNNKLIGPLIDNLYELSQKTSLLDGTTTLWQQGVVETYMKNFSLYKDETSMSDDYFTLDEASKNDIIQRNSGAFTADSKNIMTAQKDRPYLIMSGCIANVEKGAKQAFTGLELTPIYCDTPYADNNDQIKLPNGYSFLLGGNATDTFTYGGQATTLSNNNTISTQKPDVTMNITAAAGISGNFIGGLAAFMKKYIETLTQKNFDLSTLEKSDGEKTLEHQLLQNPELDGTAITKILSILKFIKNAVTNPRGELWSTINADRKIPKSHSFPLVDGGCIDNYGIISLLRRKVERIVIFINTDTALPPKGSDGKIPLEKTLADLNAMFGLPFEQDIATAAGTDFHHNHALENTDQVINDVQCNTLEQVMEALVDRKEAGEAVIATTNHLVKANDWWSINPDQDETVEICWVYNDSSQNLTDRLQPGVKALVNSFDDRHLKSPFPQSNLFLATGSGYSAKEADLLGMFSCWTVAGRKTRNFSQTF